MPILSTLSGFLEPITRVFTATVLPWTWTAAKATILLIALSNIKSWPLTWHVRSPCRPPILGNLG